MENIGELWEQDCEYDEDRDECDPTAYRMVWQRVSVLKVTLKRVYTEPYQSPQLWGYDEAHPWFDRQTLLEQGHAVWHSRPPGGNHQYKEVFTETGKADYDARTAK